MTIKRCGICDSEFPARANRKTCSDECAALLRRNRVMRIAININCVICGVQCRKYGTAKTCGEACSDENRRRRQRISEPKQCVICGRPVVAIGSTKTCGPECSATNHRNLRRRYKHNGPRPKVSTEQRLEYMSRPGVRDRVRQQKRAWLHANPQRLKRKYQQRVARLKTPEARKHHLERISERHRHRMATDPDYREKQRIASRDDQRRRRRDPVLNNRIKQQKRELRKRNREDDFACEVLYAQQVLTGVLNVNN